MSSKTLDALLEGTGLTQRPKSNNTVEILDRSESVIAHKIALQIIEAYRAKKGLPPIGE